MNIDYTKLILPNGKTVEQQLRIEAARLKDILQKNIDEWYSSYSPTMYERTYSMKNSIFADDVVSISSSGSKLTIAVKYTDQAFHNSLFGDESVNTLYLMDSGYAVGNGWHKDIPYFGFRDGGGFLQKSVDEFNSNNYFGILVDIIYQE